MNIINRFKSPIFLSSLITNIFFILKTLGYLESIGISESEYQELTTSITLIVNLIAGLNNPTDNVKF